MTRRNSSARDLGERGEHRRERDVDPHVDGTVGLFDLRGGGVDLVVVGDIGGDAQRLAAGGLDVVGGAGKAGLAAGQQRDAVTARGELPVRRRARYRRWLR